MKKLVRKTMVFALTAVMVFGVLPGNVADAATQAVELLANGSFEVADSYGFPVGWESNGKNILINGDFETGDLTAGRNFKDNADLSWSKQGSVNTVEVADALPSEAADHGNHYAKLTYKAASWGALALQNDDNGLYGMAFDSDYIFRGQMRADNTTDFTAGMSFQTIYALDTAPTLKEANVNCTERLAPNTNWQEVSLTHTTPAKPEHGTLDMPVFRRWYFRVSGATATSVLYADNLRLEKLGRSTDEAATVGTKSLKIVGYADGSDEVWTSSSAVVTPGESLSISTQVKADTLTAYSVNATTYNPSLKVIAVFDNGVRTTVGEVTAANTAFSPVTGNVTVPAGATGVQLEYTLAGIGTVYVDGASVTAQREVADIDTTGYINLLENGGFETADSYAFPANWDSDGKNLLVNGDFETGTVTAGRNFKNDKDLSWIKTGNNVTVSVATSQAAEVTGQGNHYARLDYNTANWGGICMQNDATGLMGISYDASYILRGQMRAENNTDFSDTPMKFYAISRTNTGAAGGTAAVTVTANMLTNEGYSATTDWQEVSATYTTPAKPDTDAGDMPQLNRWQFRVDTHPTATPVLYVDNLRMEKLSRTDIADKLAGERSLKIVAYDDKTDEVWTSDKVQINGGSDILLSAGVKTSELAGGVTLLVNYYQGDTLLSSACLAEGKVSDTWQTVNKIVTTPANATHASMEIRVAGASGTAWIDEVQIGIEATAPFIKDVTYSLPDLYGHGGETLAVGMQVANYASPADIMAITTLWDGDGMLCWVDLALARLEASFDAQTVPLSLPLPDTDLTHYSVRTMLFKGDGSLAPLDKVREFPALTSSFTLNNYFQNHMVLQRGEDIPVYGVGTPGEPVSATFGGVTRTVAVADDGTWQVVFPAQTANTAGQMLTVTGRGDRTFIIEDILIGDVFLMSGQSNAAFSISEVRDFQNNPDGADENIRVLGMFEASNHDDLGSDTEQSQLPGAEELNVKNAAGVTDPTWLIFSPKATASEIKTDPLTRDTSAILYYFAKQVKASLADAGETVPMGLVTAAVGGSRIEKWLPAEVYTENPGLTADQPTMKSRLYNNMINPLTKQKFKGVLWYQGCANAASAVRYETELTQLIASWRARFHDADLPFIVHQLAGYGDAYALVRDAQKRVSEAVDGVSLNVLIDLGEELDVHPQAKEPAGIRAAYLALNDWYGIANDSGKFPVYTGKTAVTHEGKAALELTFDKVVNGWYTVDAGGNRMDTPAPNGFLIADGSGDFKVANAALGQDNKIIIWNEAVTNPVHVRYAFEGFPYPAFANLYGGNGLPLTPFRTDDISVEYSYERACIADGNLLLNGDFELDTAGFNSYFQSRTNGAGSDATLTDDGSGGKNVTLSLRSANAGTSSYTAVTGAKRNLRLPISAGVYQIDVDVTYNFTDDSSALYFQAGIYDNQEKSKNQWLTNTTEGLNITGTGSGTVHLTGTVTFDNSYNGCYMYAFGPRIITKSTTDQTATVDNVVIKKIQ